MYNAHPYFSLKNLGKKGTLYMENTVIMCQGGERSPYTETLG